jgi:hypothetical protein
MNNTTQFLKKADAKGFNGTNQAINNRLHNSFNQWTNLHNDECSYVNEMRILRKPLKYYTNQVWAPAPNNNTDFSYFTAVGNQKAYNVQNNLQYPEIGSPTHLGNKRFIEYVMPLTTSPLNTLSLQMVLFLVAECLLETNCKTLQNYNLVKALAMTIAA